MHFLKLSWRSVQSLLAIQEESPYLKDFFNRKYPQQVLQVRRFHLGPTNLQTEEIPHFTKPETKSIFTPMYFDTFKVQSTSLNT